MLEYLHHKSISGALICNTKSSGFFSPCVLGVSCGNGYVDACGPGFVFLTAECGLIALLIQVQVFKFQVSSFICHIHDYTETV